MSETIPEISDEKSRMTASHALISIDVSIARLKVNQALLRSSLGMNRGDNVDNVVDTIQKEVEAACTRIPKDLPEEDACEWLRDTLLNIIYDNT